MPWQQYYRNRDPAPGTSPALLVNWGLRRQCGRMLQIRQFQSTRCSLWRPISGQLLSRQRPWGIHTGSVLLSSRLQSDRPRGICGILVFRQPGQCSNLPLLRTCTSPVLDASQDPSWRPPKKRGKVRPHPLFQLLLVFAMRFDRCESPRNPKMRPSMISRSL
jgi:hypothetical protein